MSKPKTIARAGLAAVLAVISAQAQVIQQWDFDNGTLEASSGGQALRFLDASTEAGVAFGTAASFGLPDIAGAPAKVIKVNGFTAPGGLGMPIVAGPNGGGSLVNNWTIVMDVLFPGSSDRKWRGLVETDAREFYPNAEFYVNNANGIGVDGNYSGVVTPDAWHRLAFVVDGENNAIRKYIDGVFTGQQSMGGAPQGGLDGRWALDTGRGAELFNDNDGEVAPGFVNSIQFRDSALTTGQILALGAPAASGIPTAIPPIPAHIESSVPMAGDAGAPPKPEIQVVLNPGDSAVANGSVRLMFDDAAVSAGIDQSAGIFTLAYSPAAILDPESVHKVTVAYTENDVPKTASFTFTVLKYQNVTLPAPFYLETFDSLTENEFGPGPLPAGWTVANQTQPQGTEYDLSDRTSLSYQDWTLVSAERFGAWNNERTARPAIVLNGRMVESLASGGLMWAESDQRSGSGVGQYQELFTGDIDCTGRTNVYVAWNSIYEQNQDNMDAVEYSVDGGANWLPVLYLFCRAGAGESSDIMYKDAAEGAEGTVIDAVKTFARTDANRPWGPLPAGTNYGAMIKAPVSDALAPHIKGYLNDDVLDGKRIEVVRLAQADGGKVRFRFLNTGTSAWFWGIDNLGLYEINTPVITVQPIGGTVDFGGSISLTVAATGAQSYQWFKDGVPLNNQTNSTLALAGVAAADSGSYRATVRNADGSVNSAPAAVEVVVAPRIVTQPAEVLASAGAPVSLGIEVRGQSPFAYRWQKNGADIANATNAVYSIGSAALADSGDYRAIVSNGAGSATSGAARVTVLPLAPIAQDLVLHLPFDGSANDTSGRGNHGTPEGQPETGGALPDFPAAGARIGAGALHLGRGQHVNLGAPADLSFGAGTDFTISFWVKGPAGAWAGDPSFIGTKAWTSGGNPGYVIAAQGNGGWKWNWKGAAGPRRDTSNLGVLTDGNWHNVVVSHDRAGSAYFYVDGALRTTLPIANDGDIDANAAYIGQDGTGRYGFDNDQGAEFRDVSLDDFGIWRRLLTPQEVAGIYAKGLDGQDLTKASGEVSILPPNIVAGPKSQTVSAGANITLTAAVGGTAPFSYQWQRDGTNLPGAIQATLELSNVSAGDSGEYRVAISNARGNAVSSAARLAVSTAPFGGDLVAHLKFDGDYADTSGRGNHAAAAGNPAFEAGKLGQALRVTSVRDGSRFAYATLGVRPDLQFGESNSFSVSCWVSIVSGEGDPSFIANKDWNSSGNPGWGLFGQGGGNLRVNLTGTPGGSANRFSVTTGPNLKDSAWHHVLVTFWRGVIASTYVDGQLADASPLTTTGTVDTGLPTNIGQDGKGNYTDGGSVGMDALVDDVAIWRRVLSTQEAAEIYAEGQAGRDVSTLIEPAGEVEITGVTRSGNNLAIGVSGGAGVRLQRKAKLGDATWSDLEATAQGGVFTVPVEGGSGFIRAVAQ